ncbi:alpha/beta fold hydrolase [Puerhibacterium puerhi]|uniref:alpha/beta fold hydrolase n=1 Tax=Puerhibacterium puerhi TaxID=2692623 RepID=UPI001357BBA5|nr:alpha/beta fold hydrolase [Puerhibacterium puerhi]
MTSTTLALHELHDGGGVPLVLLHGFPFDHRMWTPLANHLPPGIRALAVDLPGAGQSPLGGMPPSLEAAAAAVHRTLVAAGVANGILVGMSMGGYVALALAELHPGFVDGLAMVDTKSTADSEEARTRRLKTADEVEANQTVDAVMGMPASLLGATSLQRRRLLVTTLEAWVRGQSPAGVAWAQRAMADRPDRTHVLRQLDGPVSIVVGAEDLVTPLADAEHMAGAARDAALTVVPGAGHASPVEDPTAVAAALSLLHRRVVRHH